MKRFILSITFLFISSFLLTSCSLPIIGSGRMAALNVTANPKSSIFLDGKHIGTTPFADEKLKPGEYSIKLVPEGSAAQPWEARIKLSPGILTVVSREMAETAEKASGYVLSLEPSDSNEKTSLLVVTNPDGTVISVNGEPRGFAPKAIDDIDPGEHTLLVSSPGYLEKSLKARLIKGYKLTASIQLAKMPINQPAIAETATTGATEDKEETKALDEDIDATPTPKPSTTPKPSSTPKPSPKPSSSPKPGSGTTTSGTLSAPYVTVIDTPTGWLNVREKPSTSSEILTKINPGESYAYLDKTANGWIQIKLSDGQEGWVSSKYVKVTKASSDSVNNENE